MFLEYENSLDSKNRIKIELSNVSPNTPCAVVDNSNTQLSSTTMFDTRFTECSYVDTGKAVNGQIVPDTTFVYISNTITSPTYSTNYPGTNKYVFTYILTNIRSFVLGTLTYAKIYLKKATCYEIASCSMPKSNTTINTFDSTTIDYGSALYATGGTNYTRNKYVALEASVPTTFELACTYRIKGISYLRTLTSDYAILTNWYVDNSSFLKLKYELHINTESEFYKFLNDPNNNLDSYVYYDILLTTDAVTADRVPYIIDNSDDYEFTELT